MNVSAIIVTRGDVNLGDVVESLPQEWEVLVWNNGLKALDRFEPVERARRWRGVVGDLAVYGRYAAIEHASNDLIYVQDDDCVTDPAAIVDAWHANRGYEGARAFVDHVVCNMPQEFRHDFYRDHALVGFGAAFHRDAPGRAFERFHVGKKEVRPEDDWAHGDGQPYGFYRTCDIVFTALTPRVLVDVPKTNLWWAEDESRMYRQPQHVEERQRMLELVRQVRGEG